MSGRLSFNPITRTPTQVSQAPRPLQDWCRHSVVSMIGLANIDRIQSLPIPTPMKNMLGGLSLADFYIDGERLPPESHATHVYPATCLLTNTQVNIRVMTSGNGINKQDPSYLCSFEEDNHWLVVEQPIQTLSSLIQDCKTEGKAFDEATLWKALQKLVQYITENNVAANVHLSSDCIKFNNGTPVVDIEVGQEMEMGEPANAVYEAPEVLSNDNPDSRALVWSIGCIVYETLALEPAYYDASGTNPFLVYININSGVIPPLPTGGSAELQNLVTRCLVHDRGSRMSFEELKQIVDTHSFD